MSDKINFILFYNGQESYDHYIITYNKNSKQWKKKKWVGSKNLGTGVFGNFYPHKKGKDGNRNSLDLEVTFYGKKFTFPTSENAFQAAKCKNIEEISKFCDKSIYAGESFRMGRKVELRPDWESVKVNIMEEIVLNKFTQFPDLKQTLLDTGDAYLIEHTPVKGRDTFWADDNTGNGLNNLGKILMRTREIIGGKKVNNEAEELFKELYNYLNKL